MTNLFIDTKGYTFLATLFFALTILLTVPASLQAATGSYNFSQRVDCQTVIEDIRWSHRIWPEMNATSKPERSVVVDDQDISDKVTNNMRMEAALKEIYGIEIDAGMLQTEIDRMTSATKAPGRLNELFSALGNDPEAIAECVARPYLAESLLRKKYQVDASQHADVKAAAERFVDQGLTADNLHESGGELVKLRLIRSGTEEHCDLESPAGEFICQELQSETFDRKKQSLSSLQNTASAFIFEKPVNSEENSIDLFRYVWAKRGFGDWWQEQVAGNDWEISLNKSIKTPAATLSLASISGTTADYVLLSASGATASADTWALPPEFPTDRYQHSSIWTGSEMIIWGGTDDASSADSNSWHYDPVTDQWRRVAGTGAPTARRYHTTVWTGTEMIAWGGYEVGSWTPLGTGWRYNPATESWSSVTATGAPQERLYHSAVWTGSEMIIWGGQYSGSSSSLLNSGGRYNPVTDTWAAVATGSDVRSKHSAVWTGSEMIVWGGENGVWPGNSSTGDRYNPTTNSWTATTLTGAPGRRYSHTAVWTGSEMIIWGGQTTSSNYLNTGGRYDPATNTWAAVTSTDAPTIRQGCSIIWCDTVMVVWGGYDTDETNTGALYTPGTDSWSATSTTGAAGVRRDHGVVWTGTEMVVWGGWDGNFTINSGGRYNPVTDTWAAMTTGIWEPDNYSWSSAVWTGSEMIAWGGAHTNEGGIYDPATATWTPTSTVSAPIARSNHTAVWNGTKMIVWGGRNSSNDQVNTGGLYDPTLDSWEATSITGAPNRRSHHTAVWTGDKMIVWGGYLYTTSMIHHSTGGVYDPVTDTWISTTLTGAPTARREHRAFWTGSKMLVWGGWNGASEYSSGGLYDPVTDSWAATTTQNTPLGRHQFAAVWTGDEMVVWGGEYWSGASFSYLDTGGIYDPVTDTWSATTTMASGAPAGRARHTGVWTGDHFIVWGGYNGGSTGGRYDPDTGSWESTTTTGAPVARQDHTAVWTGDEMVVWGGDHSSMETSTGVYYPYGYHSVGGSVTGLTVGENLVLQNNGGDDLIITDNGDFVFSQMLRDETTYDVSISVQPVTAERYCAVISGYGTVSGADVDTIEVNCVSLELGDIISALQVLTGATPSTAIVDKLMSIATEKKITLAQAIELLKELAAP